MLKGNTLRIVFIALISMPLAFVQTIVPIISESRWVSWSETIYQYLSMPIEAHQQAAQIPSNVAIVKVGRSSQEKLKAKVSLTHFADFLAKMKLAERPWIISLVHQHALPGTAKDELTWTKALLEYERFIGASFRIASDIDLKDPLKISGDKNLSRSFFTRNGLAPVNLPLLPIETLDSDAYIAAQVMTGALPVLSNENHRTCMSPYFSDEQETYVAPTALTWGAALATSSQIITEYSHWPSEIDSQHKNFTQSLTLTPLICLSNPLESTKDYLSRRNILSLEFSDLINDKIKDLYGSKLPMATVLEGRILLLVPEQDTIRDPFGYWDSETQGNLVHPHEVLARYLDSLVSKNYLKKPRSASLKEAHLLAVALALILAFATIVLSYSQILGLNIAILVFLLASTIYRLNVSMIYLIPIKALFSTSITCVIIYLFIVYLHKASDYRFKRFSRNLQAKLSQCNTLEQIRIGIQNVCRSEFRTFLMTFKDFDLDLHQAASDPELAFQYLFKLGLRQEGLERMFHEREGRATQFATDAHDLDNSLSKLKSTLFNQIAERSFATQLSVAIDFQRLGTIDLMVKYEAFEEELVLQIVNFVQQELSLSWARIEDNVKVKLQGYHKLIEKSSLRTVQYFLPSSVLYRFSQNRSLEDNIKSILAPRSSKTAILQARFSNYDPNIVTDAFQKLSDILYEYYELPIFDGSQITHMKIIGDRLWFIIDEAMASNLEVTCADIILQLACIFRKEVEKQNRMKDYKIPVEMEFICQWGILTLGNLLNQKKIDYSVSGAAFNQIATLEGAKAPAKCLILTDEFVSALKMHASLSFQRLSSTTQILDIDIVLKVAESISIRDMIRRA